MISILEGKSVGKRIKKKEEAKCGKVKLMLLDMKSVLKHVFM
jgi:hypothetical protein